MMVQKSLPRKQAATTNSDGRTATASRWLKVGRGCAVEFKADATPSITWKHIDGPMLVMRNGQVHWLTWRERFECWLGNENAFTLERKHAPEFVARWLAMANQVWASERAAKATGEASK